MVWVPTSTFNERRLPNLRVGIAYPRLESRRWKSTGRGRGTRTHDPRFWRPLLYQLSYTPSVEVEGNTRS